MDETESDLLSRRRRLLQTVGGLGVAGVAGCSGLDSFGNSDAAERSSTSDGDASSPAATPPTEVNILIFSVTEGFDHPNIPYGIAQLRSLESRIQAQTGAGSVSIDSIPERPAEQFPLESAATFPSDAADLQSYDTIVFFNTTGDVLTDDQQVAFEEYIRSGGGFVGIHSAADTEYDWEFYGELIGGAYFDGHPAVQEATVTVTDSTHPSTEHLPNRWRVTDEWYDFVRNPRGDVHVLATVQEDSYDGADMSRADHPIAWCQEINGGRSWYTGRGHTADAFDEDAFIEHVMEGILWAGGLRSGGASGTVWDNYDVREVATDISEAMKLNVGPEGSVAFTERTGRVAMFDPSSNSVSTVLDLDVYTGEDNGLQGLAFDPNFADNGWLYMYYSPPDEVVGDDPYYVLSRFTMQDNSIDPGSEIEILRVHTQRHTCCHTGGALAFDSKRGDLYLSTGDNTNPHESNGFTPIDERDGRAYYDAQRTAGNTADLRGKILRIRPQDDGSYTVPSGNLFTGAAYAAEREAGTVRPEIYVMGCRNPFTMSVDQQTTRLLYGDYGPDSRSWGAQRGPPGIEEWNVVASAHNSGWPYVTGPALPYVDYDFERGTSGEPFDPKQLTNTSPNNTGLKRLPPARAATIWSPNTGPRFFDNVPSYASDYVPDVDPWPNVSGGDTVAGPIYRRPETPGEAALPESMDGTWLIGRWAPGTIETVSFDDAGEVLDVAPFLPTPGISGLMDIKVRPDGAVYVLDRGGWDGTGGTLYVIEHTESGLGFELHVPQSDLRAGQSTTATTRIRNQSEHAITDVTISLTDDAGVLTVSPERHHINEPLRPGDSSTVAWDLRVTEDVPVDETTVTATFAFTWNNEALQSTSKRTIAFTEPNDTGDDIDPLVPGDTIELDGTIAGWSGSAPEAIAGVTNPPLVLRAGETYTLRWTNQDGAPHNFEILAAADPGAAVVDDITTSIVQEQGVVQTVTFVARPEMARYQCSPHRTQMHGRIEVK
jgi:glucose/arabinose dehydrogenase/type 1 glutamine amidotransferase